MSKLAENVEGEIFTGHDPTIFRWKTPRGRRFRLAMFLAAALALHMLLFYLFQVVYPPSKRLVRQPVGITVLSPSTPGASAILNELAERTPTFEGSLAEGAPLMAAGENFVADYVATYHGYKPELASPSSKILPKPLPPLATPGAVELPEVTRRGGPGDISVAAEAVGDPLLPVLVVEGPTGTGRVLLEPPSLAGITAEELAALPSPPRLRVVVDDRGRVLFVGMISLLPADLERRLRSAAYASRFRAGSADGPVIEFLQMSVAWVAPTSPPENHQEP